MNLAKISLQNFRNHEHASFDFEHTTIIVGKNTIGKTNIIEGIHFLSHGKSFRASKDIDTIQEGKDFSNIYGVVRDQNDSIKLSIQLVKNGVFLSKKYLVNDIAKRQTDFISKMTTTLFEPGDLEALTSSPAKRRSYIDSILTQTDKKYRSTLSTYEKALKSRNKLLHLIKEGKKFAGKEEFDYWDNLLITNGAYITREREEYIQYLNSSVKTTFQLDVFYGKSTITPERLAEYFEIEQKVGVTLVGPQRDDFLFYFGGTKRLVAEYGSRGEQRLAILQLKLLEIEYLKKMSLTTPILLLDDIFSELDSANIQKIIPLISECQTIITTTHKEFVPEEFVPNVYMIDL